MHGVGDDDAALLWQVRGHEIEDAERDLLAGTRVWHKTRGSGTVTSVDLANERGKPYTVKFDGGDVHRYSIESMTKMRLLSEGEEVDRVASPRQASPRQVTSRVADRVPSRLDATDRFVFL